MDIDLNSATQLASDTVAIITADSKNNIPIF